LVAVLGEGKRGRGVVGVEVDRPTAATAWPAAPARPHCKVEKYCYKTFSQSFRRATAADGIIASQGHRLTRLQVAALGEGGEPSKHTVLGEESAPTRVVCN